MVSRITHAVGGYVAAVIAGVDPLIAVAGALLPDLDYPFGSLHRKIFHNVWVLFATYFISGPALAVGFFSHLLLDSLTPHGINWLWPIPAPRIRGPISTGTIFDYILAGVLLIFVAVGMWV